MSIVYDYLKQIKESKEPAREGEKAVLPAGVTLKSKSGISTWLKILFVFLLCLCIGLAVYFLAPRASKTTVKLYHPPVSAAHAATTQSSDPSYILEGIIYNPSQPFAILNGKMLEVGNVIGDYELTKITPDSVTLLNTQDKTTRSIHL